MVATDWLFTLIQASATFVAIVGAFFTAKILSIASEKQTLRNRISVIDSELCNRRRLQTGYKQRIDSIQRQWAEESVNRFFDWFKVFWSFGKSEEPPSIEMTLAAFYEKEKREPDNEETEIIRTRYPSLRLEIEKQIADEKRERQHPSLIPRIAFPEVKIATPFEVALESARAEAANYRDLRGKYEQEANSIAILEGTKKTYRDQINALAFPAHAVFGFLSLAYFAVVGVVLPLAYALYVPIMGVCTAEIFLLLFISGLSLTFAYFYAEIKAAVTKESIKTEDVTIPDGNEMTKK